MSEVIEINVSELKSVKLKLNGEEHTLTELTGAQRDAYVTASSQRVKQDTKGNTKNVDMTGYQADLISLSLIKGDGTRYSKEEIQKWPASAQSQLYKMARKLSALRSSDIEDDEAKND